MFTLELFQNLHHRIDVIQHNLKTLKNRRFKHY